MKGGLTVLFFIFTFSLFADEGNHLVEATNIAREYCTDKNGQYTNEALTNVFIEIDEHHVVSCFDFLNSLTESVNDSYSDSEFFLGIECGPEQARPVGLGDLENDMQSIEQAADGCENPLGLVSCTKELVCNMTESLASAATAGLFSRIDHVAGIEVKSCSDNPRGNCWETFLKGILDNLTVTWDSVSGITTMAWENRESAWEWIKSSPGRLYEWSKDRVSSAHDYFTSFDSFSSARLHMMSRLSDFELEKWLTDQAQALGSLASGLYESVSQAFENSLRENYGCQRWEGNECVKPLDIDCMNCDDYINGFCGFMGVAAPELALLYISGGYSAITRPASLTTGKLASRIGSEMRSTAETARRSQASSFRRSQVLSSQRELKNINSALSSFRAERGSLIQKVELPKTQRGSLQRVCRWER